MERKETGIASPGFLMLLALLFIALKLTGQIAWSWWWVLAPIWVPSAIGLTILTFLGIALVFLSWAAR